MDTETNIVNKEGNNFLKKYCTKKFKKFAIILTVILIAIAIVVIGLGKNIWSESKTTKIGFEDIGELVTQAAYCTEVNVTEDAKELFGIAIPFTQSKYIYSYDIDIKAGFNFEDIEWKLNGQKIEVKLPKAKVLSNDIFLDSFKIYHEKESIFNKITLTENNEAMKQLKESAEKNAVGNGLLDNARINAESILIGFFSKVYDLDKYEIIFQDK